MLLILLATLLLADPEARGLDAGAAGIPCKTLDDCWLDSNGSAIKRPATKKGRAIPRGDCGGKLVWLRNRLACTENVCTVTRIGDKC